MSNEQGYALLIVLFLVVLIISLSAVFFRSSISNAKQESRTDQNHLSYTAAEMGVDYYVTLFTNRFLEVRKQIWDHYQIKFKAEVESEAFEGDIHVLAASYQTKIANAIKDKLDVVNTSYVPSDVYFHKKMQKSSITIVDNNYIEIKDDVIGVYQSGKEAILFMELKFPIPSLLLEEDSSDPSGGDAWTLPKLQLSDFEIGKVIKMNKVEVTDEKKYPYKKIYEQSNVVVRKKGDLELNEIENNLKSVDIWATGDMQSTKVYGNDNVDVEINGKFQTGLIQQNKGFLKIYASNDFSSTNNIYGNQNVDILTNGKFQADGNVDSNTGKLFISSSGDLTSGSLSMNKDVHILTNGKFSTGLLSGNTGKLIIESENDFQSEKLQYNEHTSIKTKGKFNAEFIYGNRGVLSIKAANDFQTNKIDDNEHVFIEVKGKFQSGLIYGNKGSLVIKASDDFQSAKIENNQNGFIQTDGKFQTNGIYGNNNLEIYSKSRIQSDEKIENNTNLNIWTNKDFQTNGSIYGNKGININSGGSVQVGNIQSNSNLKIVTLKDFKADNIYLSENSLICVGKDIDVNGQITLPSSSHIYMRGKQKNNKRNTEFLEPEEWDKRCGITINGNPSFNTDGLWGTPIIDVKY